MIRFSLVGILVLFAVFADCKPSAQKRTDDLWKGIVEIAEDDDAPSTVLASANLTDIRRYAMLLYRDLTLGKASIEEMRHEVIVYIGHGYIHVDHRFQAFLLVMGHKLKSYGVDICTARDLPKTHFLDDCACELKNMNMDQIFNGDTRWFVNAVIHGALYCINKGFDVAIEKADLCSRTDAEVTDVDELHETFIEIYEIMHEFLYLWEVMQRIMTDIILSYNGETQSINKPFNEIVHENIDYDAFSCGNPGQPQAAAAAQGIAGTNTPTSPPPTTPPPTTPPPTTLPAKRSFNARDEQILSDVLRKLRNYKRSN